MPFEQFYASFRARWMLVVFLVGLTLSAAIGYAFFRGQAYVAKASVLIDLHAIDPLTRQINPITLTELQQQIFFVNNVYLALNDQVALHLANLDPNVKTPEFLAFWERETHGQGDPVGWYAKILANSVNIAVKKNATVIEFSAYGNTPEQASQLANAYAKSFIEVSQSVKLKHIEARITALQAHTQKIKQELTQTWQEFLASRSALGITNLDELNSEQTIKLLELNKKIAQKSFASNNIDNKLKFTNNNIFDSQDKTAQNFSYYNLATDLAHQEAALQQYKALLGPNHPNLKKIDQQIKELRANLDQENLRLHQQDVMKSELNQAVNIGLQKNITAQKNLSLAELNGRNKLIGLIQKIHTLNLNYSSAYQEMQNKISDHVLSYSNLSFLSPALPPTEAEFPNWYIILPFASAIGLIIACMTLFLLERIDNRIYTIQTLSQKLPIPHLGTVSVQPLARLKSKRSI